jgi:chemotaxis protein CheX
MTTIPDSLLTCLVACTEDVFERMVFMPVMVGTPDARVSPEPHAHVAATVGFAGHRNGVVSLHSSIECATQIAAAMLGLTPSEVQGEMPDAMGEVVNMIAGSLRTRMAEIEPAWTITCPWVTVGSNFVTTYPSDVAEARVPFTLGPHTIEVELVLSNRTGRPHLTSAQPHHLKHS